MANLSRNGRAVTGASFTSLKTILNGAEFSGVSEIWQNVVFRVPTGQVQVEISVTNLQSAPTTHFEAIPAGEERFYERVNMDCVFHKSSDTSVIEFSGTPESK